MTLRNFSILGLLICISAIAGAHYLEYEYMLAPCPMCMLQRCIFWVLGALFLIGTVFKIKGALRYLYSTSVILFSILGLTIAMRQVWLQYFAPPQASSCSASLERLIELYPILDALKMALSGSSECATIDFTFLSISVAGWSMILFASFIIVGLYIIYLQKKRRI